MAEPASEVLPASPRVSCIIIFLDEERFLGQAIDSVLAQTVSDWELILVDDGSTDRSEEVARSYVAAHAQRVRYVTHPGRKNRGMSASRNLGLRHARGEYVAFLDGDDIWLADKLAHQLSLFERYPQAGMVCGATLYWHSSVVGGGRPDELVPVGALPGGGNAVPQDALIHPPRLFRTLYPLGRGASPSSSGLMVTRALMDQIGGFVDRFTGLYEDQAFKIKVYLNAPVFVSSKTYDRYRQHAESSVATGDATGARERKRFDYLLWLHEYVRQHRPGDQVARLQLSRALLRFRYPRLRGLWMRFKPWLRRPR
ncbi:glycosyltransferase family 2 protein [uncultured Sphingomonas sp.]|uniref:glycosyltransferase family 2 protein n=1 Tax=uncultured Sphingomonas sp. TaxID=158754 RepID=UPI0025E2FE80|nr:glycosyltransferase family 2 protein [uncultured Sphingomonas sp.]